MPKAKQPVRAKFVTPKLGAYGQLFVGSDIYAIRVEAVEIRTRPILFCRYYTQLDPGCWVPHVAFKDERLEVQWQGDEWRLVKSKAQPVRWRVDFNSGAREHRDQSF